ncbi:hypothetical protein Droror1_Dr00012607 [Drosera rotundifolia]
MSLILFSYQSHLCPIKSIALSFPIAASAVSTDNIKLYDLYTNTELGSLLDNRTLSSSTPNFILDLYAKYGSLELAEIVFEGLKKRDVLCWNSVFSMCVTPSLFSMLEATIEVECV